MNARDILRAVVRLTGSRGRRRLVMGRYNDPARVVRATASVGLHWPPTLLLYARLFSVYVVLGVFTVNLEIGWWTTSP